MSTNDNTFDEEEYQSRVFSDGCIDAKAYKTMQKAFELAHDVRKFEIELFWKRGTYFWAFILASFTAYFATFKTVLGQKELRLSTLVESSGFAKIVLLSLAGITFIFCLSWVLVNKGSKFWQKNWEAHIDMLEDSFSGKLYKTFLNTKSSGFGKIPFNKNAYDYSVTQVTTVGSIILTLVSIMLVIFHILLCIPCVWYRMDGCSCLILYMVFFAIVMVIAWRCLKSCVGNKDSDCTEKKWYQRQVEEE